MTVQDSKELAQRIISKSAVIGIIGLGYVGLPLALSFAESGFRVIGIDIDSEKIKKLRQGESYIRHISSDSIAKALSRDLFWSSSDFSEAAKCDALILCVPTPLNAYREPDLSCVIGTIEALVPFLRKGQLVSLESTTYPGTTEEELLPRIEQAGLKVGQDIFLVFSPEREDPGNAKFTTKTITKVVGGTTSLCLEMGLQLYSQVIDRVIPLSSTKAAEMTKLLENIYRAVNIGLVNELKIVADSMGINIWEVIDAASTKPFGFMPFYPGPGLGGHCIPIDPFYLTWKAREYGIHTKFIELAGEVNTSMPQWVLGKVVNALNDHGRAVKNSKIMVLGLAYKKNVDDIRESPAVELMELLREKGAILSYADPYIPVFPRMRDHVFDLRAEEVNQINLQKADCILIATNHDSFDYNLIQKNSRLIIDTRGCYRRDFPNVVRA